MTIATFRGNTPSNPFSDVEGDLGDECYVTGNGTGGPGAFDLDGGGVNLTSPIMNLQDNYDNPVLRYSFWWMQGSGSPDNQNDSIFIYALSNMDTVLLESLGPEEADPRWRESSFELASYLNDLSAVKVIFRAQDTEPDHIVEMGVDAFIVEGSTVSVEEDIKASAKIKILPNPASSQLKVQLIDVGDSRYYRLSLINNQGVQLLNRSFSGVEYELDLSGIPSGIYFVQIMDQKNGVIQTEKMVIVRN
jgi:hypothetical protein